MSAGTWKCTGCGQVYSLAEASCPICRITRIDRHVIGKIETPERTAKAAPEKIDVSFPFTLKDARFNLPLDKGAVWSSGCVLATEAGLFLVSEKDGLDLGALSGAPPAAAGPVGSLSIFVPRAAISRVVHHKLTGEFIEVNGRQKIPLRLAPAGWADLNIICDQLGIVHT